MGDSNEEALADVRVLLEQNVQEEVQENNEVEEEDTSSEEEGDDDSSDFPLVGAPGQYWYEDRMKLTEQERRWALAIKQAVAEEGDLKPLSDFWYCQFGIIDRDNVERSLDRIRTMQAFREEYDFVDTWEAGVEFVRELVFVMPRFWLALNYNPRDGNYILALDVARFYAKILQARPELVRIWIVATYAVAHALSPDFKAIRKGSILLMENQGYDLKTNFGFSYMKKVYSEVAGVYPFKYDQVKNFNTGVLFNIILSMLRAFMPKEHSRKLQRGCRTADGVERLDEFYLSSGLQVANEKFIQSVKASLQWRFYCQSKFSLEQDNDGD
ncbi:expressed unknown protein [Seminavis robusta]|uniref:Uncharacterized protein n=1 Tax=Seminavis robusta TaxID=568900 RepID=A0A9N8HIY5_9STRA|nr:expressed unknown protein [Seminavis robusta]|eukprot:Sro525_g160180.1 n/a (327) ;mRNA; r:45647-46627